MHGPLSCLNVEANLWAKICIFTIDLLPWISALTSSSTTVIVLKKDRRQSFFLNSKLLSTDKRAVPDQIASKEAGWPGSAILVLVLSAQNCLMHSGNITRSGFQSAAIPKVRSVFITFKY